MRGFYMMFEPAHTSDPKYAAKNKVKSCCGHFYQVYEWLNTLKRNTFPRQYLKP